MLAQLTRQVPFEMVDEVPAETGGMQARVRALPSRVVVYLLLAGCLSAESGYQSRRRDAPEAGGRRAWTTTDRRCRHRRWGSGRLFSRFQKMAARIPSPTSR
ncbi:transposase domain-containing protein [Nonomuraea helvata]|uniref:Transposase domain-containing protein n=1 Tax=Nonomuraea helvata TaxID=37484 RepID=A0ABV5S6W1_9ACTN